MKWRHTCGGILRHVSNTLLPASCDIMRKSKEICQDIRKRIVDLHKSGSSVGTVFRCLNVPCSSVHMFISKCKVQPSYHSGGRWVLCPRDEHALVWNVCINPRTKAKYLVKILDETLSVIIHSEMSLLPTRPLGLSVITPVSHYSSHYISSHYSKSKIKKPDYSLQMHTGTKTFSSGHMWSDVTKIELFDHFL